MKFIFLRPGMQNRSIPALHDGQLMRCPKVGEFITMVDEVSEREVMEVRHVYNHYQDHVEIILGSNYQY